MPLPKPAPVRPTVVHVVPSVDVMHCPAVPQAKNAPRSGTQTTSFQVLPPPVDVKVHAVPLVDFQVPLKPTATAKPSSGLHSKASGRRLGLPPPKAAKLVHV